MQPLLWGAVNLQLLRWWGGGVSGLIKKAVSILVESLSRMGETAFSPIHTEETEIRCK